MSTSTTDNHAILNLSSDPNDSFKSVSSDVPLNDLNNVPELHGHSAPTSLKEKLYICVLLLLIGGFEGKFKAKEVLNLDIGLSGQLAKI